MSDVQAAAAEQSHETDYDEVDRDDMVEESRQHEDQDTGDQRPGLHAYGRLAADDVNRCGRPPFGSELGSLQETARNG
jgi:hypothetical protein